MDFSYLNNNPYFSGIALLMLNLGSRYIMSDLGEFHQKVLSHEIVKKIILFFLFFVGTRNVITSLILTIMFSVIIYGIFNENSKYSLIPNQKHLNRKIKEYYVNYNKYVIKDK